MSKNQSVSKRRNQLRIHLEEGNYKALVDILLQRIGRGKPVSPLMGTTIFFAGPMVIGLLIATFLGELSVWQRVIQNLLPNPILLIWIVFSLITASASMIIANVYFHKMVATIRDHVLESVESLETLNDIENWVMLLCNKRLAWLTAVLGGLITSPIIIIINSSAAGVFVGIGHSALLFLFAAQSSLFISFIYGIMVFTFRLRGYELRLFESDPANSEVIARLSDSLSWFVYIVAVYGAAQTFGIVTLQLPYFSFILFLFWIPIVAIFLMSQLSLSRIIQNSKWKALNTTQQKIAAIQKKSALKKEDQDNLLWLLNYHDRVKLTRNSAFDLKAGISFLNSMLLPLVGFILGNLDNVIAFFR